MQEGIKKIDGALKSTWYTTITAVLPIISFGWFLWQQYEKEQFPTLPFIVFLLTFSLYLLSFYYSLRVREDNQRLKTIANDFRDINRIYRTKYEKCLPANNENQEFSFRSALEKETLDAVCQRIEGIFATLISKPCMVSIKLLTKEDDCLFAETLARSESDSVRDHPLERYKVLNGKNTAFDEALRKETKKGKYYFSPNLEKEDDYRNERPDYLQHYKCVLVVPISESVSNHSDQDTYGFLCVDTKSANRLNDSNHLVILNALADQMSVFMSFMRSGSTMPSTTDL